jgi:hypothetical protein
MFHLFPYERAGLVQAVVLLGIEVQKHHLSVGQSAGYHAGIKLRNALHRWDLSLFLVLFFRLHEISRRLLWLLAIDVKEQLERLATCQLNMEGEVTVTFGAAKV